MPSGLDAQIDHLYQLPLSEFTQARNALAKLAGPQAAAIKALEKPNVAAWAVNQLYWQRRKSFDRLVSAAERLRTAVTHQLGSARAGADALEKLHKAEAAHAEALKVALDEIRRVMETAGEVVSPATLSAVQDTLRALPASDPLGRLSRPLRPMGFEALAGMVPVARVAEQPPGKSDGKSTDRDRQQREAEAREHEARRRALAEIEEQLQTARTAEQEGATAVARARERLEAAEDDHDRLRREVAKLADRAKRLKAGDD